MRNFALIGLGYIAERHVNAIKHTKSNLIAIFDKNSSGMADRFFPYANFFDSFEEFDEFVSDEADLGNNIDYLSICSPGFLHRSHVCYGIRKGMDIICEKPLAISSAEIEKIIAISEKYDKSVHSVFQLRFHPAIIDLYNKINSSKQSKKYEIELSYVAFRGQWFSKSWKGDEKLSGGLLMEFGIHFFDLLIWIFGGMEKCEMYVSTEKTYSGYIELEKANVKWVLSVEEENIPTEVRKQGNIIYRSLSIDGEQVDFSTVPGDLHTEVYKHILSNKTISNLEDCKYLTQCIEAIKQTNLSSFNKKKTHQIILNN